MEAHTCVICNNSYNLSDIRPLVLPCGHSFCQDCLHKVEAAGDKRCPVCRQTWGNLRVTDMPSCYQLIPADGQAVNSDGLSSQDRCSEHDDHYGYWCETCVAPACRKCMRVNHRGCDFVLIEEKENILREQLEANLPVLSEKVAKNSAYLTDNLVKYAFVKSMVEKLQSLEREILDYQTNMQAWQAEAQKLLSSSIENPRVLLKLTRQDSAPNYLHHLDELGKKIRSRPSSLLVHMAAAYQSSREDVNTFVSALKNSVDARRAEGPTFDESLVAKARDLSIGEAIAALSDGGHWVVSDATAAAAVQNVLRTTCKRPAKLEVIWGDLAKETVVEFQALRDCEKKWTLDCFHNFGKPSSEARGSASSKLITLIRSDCWSSLTQFCGHLDETGVRQLPATIKSVGLVLRDEEDMAAVNALARAAFSTLRYVTGRARLKWPDWTELNLSVAMTFRAEYWNMTWQLYSVANRQQKFVGAFLTTALPFLGVRLRLHLPQLMLSNRLWMGDLFQVMGLKEPGIKRGGFSYPVPLLLPDARIDPDALLGVLRDSGHRWDVHLPVNLPQIVPKEEVGERYKGYGHLVTWDL